jgi:flagellar biosynthetic protein FlhB
MAKDPSKTERATPKRRNKVRQEGNVPKSQEMSKTATVLAGIIGLYAYFSIMAEHLIKVFRYFFINAALLPVTSQNVHATFVLGIKELAIIVLPVICFIGLVSFIILRKQVGSLWTTKIFGFKLKNFNLLAGLKRMFASPQTLLRLGKSAALALIIGVVPFLFIRNEFVNFLPLYYSDAAGVGAYMLRTGFRMMLYTLIPMIVVSLLDLWFTRRQYEENIKMTKHEIKDEQRQAEGDPRIKLKQRQKMFDVMRKRMMQEVPKADVIITNPTHYAVALRYDPTIGPAPLVVAKGVNRVAETIKEIARAHGVPIRENRPLARSLYKMVEIGQAIPPDMYKAVAAILSEIWKLRGKMPGQP